MKPLLVHLLLLMALVFLSESQVRADMVNYSYEWSVVPSSIPGLPGSTGSVSVTPNQPGNAQSTVGASTPTLIPGATVTTNSAAISPPDAFLANYSMTVKLTDSATNTSGSLSWSGTIAGTLTQSTSQLVSVFHNPLTQHLTLGTHVFTVTIDPVLVHLPVPGASAPALIDALVTVANKGGGTSGGGPIGTPEPSGLVLGATAVFGLTLRRLARMRASS
jgi:hypothetical protein